MVKKMILGTIACDIMSGGGDDTLITLCSSQMVHGSVPCHQLATCEDLLNLEWSRFLRK